MKILAIRPKKSAVFTYRMTRPLTMLGAKFRKSILRKNEKIMIRDLAERFKELGNIWVFKYIKDPYTADLVVTMRNHAKTKLVVDIDDNIWQTPMGNIIRQSDEFNKAVAVTTGLVECADWVTVSTEPLKQALLPLNDKIEVLPNLIDPSEWNHKRKKRGKVRIGWIWSPTHYPDMPVVAEALEEINKKYDVEFVIFGANRNILKFPTTNVPPVPFSEYPKTLTEEGLDISICPLADNDFNKCKSNIKWMESTMAGAAVVASKVYPYENSILNGYSGYLAKGKNQWVKHLGWLIESKGLRERLVGNARKEVLKNYDVNKDVKWRKFYQCV